MLAAMVRSPENQWWWTAIRVPEHVWDLFYTRGDHLIGIQEFLALCLAAETFAGLLTDQRWVAWVDNQRVIGSVTKGSAGASDANLVVARFWLSLAAMDSPFVVYYVPSRANVADGPTRGVYTHVERLSAVWREPLLPTYLLSLWDSSAVQEALDLTDLHHFRPPAAT